MRACAQARVPSRCRLRCDRRDPSSELFLVHHRRSSTTHPTRHDLQGVSTECLLCCLFLQLLPSVPYQLSFLSFIHPSREDRLLAVPYAWSFGAAELVCLRSPAANKLSSALVQAMELALT